jgi:Ca2+/Na+ antiporter
LRIVTAKGLILICAGISVFVFLLIPRLTFLRWELVSLLAILAVFAILFKKSGSLAYKSLVGEYSLRSWIRLLYPDIDSLRIERDGIFYTSKGKVIGAKAFKVVDVPHTWRELSMESLLRRLTHYSRMVSKDDIILIAFHRKSMVDKEEFVKSLRKLRSIQIEKGKEEEFFDLARQKDRMLAKIRDELGDPSDVVFYVLVYAIANSVDEADRKLKNVVQPIITRFEADIGVKMREVEGDKLLKSFKILP